MPQSEYSYRIQLDRNEFVIRMMSNDNLNDMHINIYSDLVILVVEDWFDCVGAPNVNLTFLPGCVHANRGSKIGQLAILLFY